jgi:hypothetical protein
MSDLPAEELSAQWMAKEKEVNADTRPGIQAATPAEAIKKRRK